MSDNYRLNMRGLRTYDADIKQYFNDKLPKVMVGATRYSDGRSGLVPQPIVGDNNKYLRGDGTWSTIPSFTTKYYINESSIKILQEQKEVAGVECILTKKVDLEGHLTVSLFSSETCTLTVRVMDNNNQELFTPQELEVESGYNDFDLSHAYLSRLEGVHYFTVTMQCSNGYIVISSRGIMYAVYGGISDEENVGIDIIDLAIKNSVPEESPSEIWTLGYLENHLLLRVNDYNSPNDNDWEEIFDFGVVKGGAIEFYGNWYEIIDSNNYSLITEEKPYVFIIKDNNDLVYFNNGDYNTETILASNVSKAKVCCGYKSNVEDNYEQGLIVVFIRNGNVYYKQLTSNGWTPNEELYMTGDAYDVNVHRLPDYRIGILVKTLTNNYWYITDRVFIGNTYKTEKINNTINGVTIINMIPSNRVNEALGVGTPIEKEQDYYYNNFIAEFEGKLYFIDSKTINDLKSNMTATRGGSAVVIDSITIEDNKLIIKTKDDMKCGSTFSISWNLMEFVTTNSNGSRMMTKSGCTWDLPANNIVMSLIDSINISMSGNTTINVRPIGYLNNIIIDETEVLGHGDLTIGIGEIKYSNSVNSDQSQVGMTGELNITVSLVGDVPI